MGESTQADGAQTRAGSPAHVQTPDEWSRRLGVIVRDPDGWRNDGKSWDDPISEDEFRRRASLSTVEHPFPVSPVQTTDHAGDRVSPVTDDMVEAGARAIADLDCGWSELDDDWQDTMRTAVRAAIPAALAVTGCTVVALPEPTRLEPAAWEPPEGTQPYWRADPDVDDAGAFVRVHLGHRYLDSGDAVRLGLALIAAGREAERLASGCQVGDQHG